LGRSAAIAADRAAARKTSGVAASLIGIRSGVAVWRPLMKKGGSVTGAAPQLSLIRLRSEPLHVLEVHVAAVRDVVLRVERVGERVVRGRRTLGEHVVHAQLDGTVPRQLVTGLHVVVGGRTKRVARGQAVLVEAVVVGAEALTRERAVLDQARVVAADPG